MIIFLHSAFSSHSESNKISHQLPLLSTLALQNNGVSNHVTFNDNIISNDHSTNPSMDFTEKSNNYEIIDNESGKMELISSGVSGDGLVPFVSIIIATNNEEDVIHRLLKSLERLTYNREKFQVIVVDDSTDSTTKILEQWTKKMLNLSVVRRKQRIGTKGGALNLALQSLREDSSWILVIDADTILPPDIIEQFLFRVISSQNRHHVIQGYCIPYNSSIDPNYKFENWISRGIEFRLANRNMIEFVARKNLGLPVQVTGNLFMIKTSILKKLGFSTDICEDWDLTLNLYLRDHGDDIVNANVLFDETLNARNQAPISLMSYFKQRLRVSEGHTRGFIKAIPKLMPLKQPLKNKIEIFFTGIRYLRYLLILSLIFLDFIGLFLADSNRLNDYFIISLAIQCLAASIFIVVSKLGLVICTRNAQYTFKVWMSELILEICVSPAIVLGSLLGIFRKKGSFHKTQRIHTNATMQVI